MKIKISLLLIVLLGLIVRLYKVENPVADWHSWRQADTAAVARNFYKQNFAARLQLKDDVNFNLQIFNPFYGVDVLKPRYDDMSGVAQFPIPNPNRYRFVEFPIYNLLVYFGYLINNGVDEKIARLVSIFFSLGSLIFTYLISRKYFGDFTAVVSAFLFAVLPFNIFFSRVILPEPTLVFFSLGMFYFIDKWVEKSTKYFYLWSLLFTTCAFLIKPAAIFYLLPLIYKLFLTESSLVKTIKKFLMIFIPSIIPFIFWRVWMSQHPEGIPASNWLFNGNGIRFKLIFWYWIFQDRLGREILTLFGSVLFFIGLLVKPFSKEGWLMHTLLLSMFLFVIVFATGNVQHDYYQTLIIPVLVIFAARGFTLMLKGIDGFIARLWTIPFAILFLIMMIYTGWDQIKGFYQINNPAIVEAGEKADEILPKDAVLVAPYQGDTSFLYQTNRIGWAMVAFPVKDLIDTFKVHYFISTAKDAKTKWVMRKYTVLVDNPTYVIIDLTKESPNFDRINDLEPM